ncbi:MAG: YbjN domain-containing protein [Acidimicrobiales bacterium]
MTSGRPTISEVIGDWLRSRDLPHSWEDPGRLVAFPASSEDHSWTVYALCIDQVGQLLVHSVRDDRIPEGRRAAVGTFVTRANYGMVLGNFEMDLDDGELRFKTSIDVGGDRLSEALLEHLVLANIAAFGRYLPGIDAVVSGTEPDAAIESVEG